MKIRIETIPHHAQRYDTPGDWVFTPSGDLVVWISELADQRMEFLLSIHETIEAILCRQSGISPEMVDDWDRKWTPHGSYLEPGADPMAPYHIQHFATETLERQLAAYMQVDWEEYGRKIAALSPDK